MKNKNTITTNRREKLEQVIRRRKEMLNKVKEAESRLRNELKENRKTNNQAGILRPRTLPRGILTMALAQILSEGELSVPEIIDKAEKRFKKTPNFSHRCRCLLTASDRFKRVSRGVYKNSGPLKGHLFQRLQNEVVLV